MKNNLEQKTTQVADTIVNSYAFLGSKRILILSYILILTFSLVILMKSTIFFFIVISIIPILLYRRRYIVKAIEETLLKKNVYYREAKGSAIRLSCDAEPTMYATDTEGMYWKGLRYPDDFKLTEYKRSKEEGYIVFIYPIKHPLFIKSNLMLQIKEVSPLLRDIPDEKVPPQKMNMILFVLVIIIATFAGLWKNEIINFVKYHLEV